MSLQKHIKIQRMIQNHCNMIKSGEEVIDMISYQAKLHSDIMSYLRESKFDYELEHFYLGESFLVNGSGGSFAPNYKFKLRILIFQKGIEMQLRISNVSEEFLSYYSNNIHFIKALHINSHQLDEQISIILQYLSNIELNQNILKLRFTDFILNNINSFRETLEITDSELKLILSDFPVKIGIIQILFKDDEIEPIACRFSINVNSNTKNIFHKNYSIFIILNPNKCMFEFYKTSKEELDRIIKDRKYEVPEKDNWIVYGLAGAI